MSWLYDDPKPEADNTQASETPETVGMDAGDVQAEVSDVAVNAPDRSVNAPVGQRLLDGMGRKVEPFATEGHVPAEAEVTVKEKSDEAEYIKKGPSIPGPRGGTLYPVRTSEEGTRRINIRWNRTRAAARAGVTATYDQIPDVPPAHTKAGKQLAVIARMFEQHALNACDPSARGSSASLRAVMDYAYKPERDHSARADTAAQAAGSAFGTEMAREMLSLLRSVVGGK